MSLLMNLLFSLSAFAASDRGTLNCETRMPVPPRAFQAHISVQARIVDLGEAEDDVKSARLNDIIVKAYELDDSDKKVATGRRNYVEGSTNSRARKYKDHYQVALEQLIDTENFSQYFPLGQCAIQLNLPIDLWSKSNFEAVAVSHCEQNGGTQGLECQFVPSRR